ncbi:MAG: hypothetical protein ACYTFF_04290 [Planctomycetota bacterium]
MILGALVSAAGGATVIDMPAAPSAARPGIAQPEPSETADAPTLGDVALQRYARTRHAPAYTSLVSPAWRGWPYGRFGFGYGIQPSWGWGWNWGWNWGRNWGWNWRWHGWGYPYCGGWGFRYPYWGGYRFRPPIWGPRWRGARIAFRGRWR